MQETNFHFIGVALQSLVHTIDITTKEHGQNNIKKRFLFLLCCYVYVYYYDPIMSLGCVVHSGDIRH